MESECAEMRASLRPMGSRVLPGGGGEWCERGDRQETLPARANRS